MTIHPQHVRDLERLGKYISPPMLMLGRTDINVPAYATAHDFFRRWVGDEYDDLDLDDGDYGLDLNEDIGLSETHRTVFNLGTLEHVWNAHNAWANALRAVKVGGHFLTHSPVVGYRNHGLHLTSAPAIRAFVSKNGFDIVEEWTTRREVGELLWLVAAKRCHIEALGDYEPAWQVYEQGQKKEVR